MGKTEKGHGNGVKVVIHLRICSLARTSLIYIDRKISNLLDSLPFADHQAISKALKKSD